MLASNITGLSGVPFVSVTASEIVAVKETLPSRDKETSVRGITVEEYVRNYFSDIPIMIEVAKCESHFRQRDENGEVLRGEQNILDRGVMQINEFYHNNSAQKLGYNILTLEGNTSYARLLFEKYGLKPWTSSAKCWGKTTAFSEYEAKLLALALNKN